MTDRDIKTDFEESYNAGSTHWSSYWSEAQTDVKFRMGDHYSARDKSYLLSQDREALVWNKCHRIVNLIAGYEQRNLMALKIDPFEGADEKTASQFSGLVMNNMFWGGGYMAMSGTFEFGSVISGMNLLEPWIDKSDDMLNGDIRFRRLPHNRFILDPTFQDRDLDRDCGFIITRDYFNRDQCAGLLPEREKDIKLLKGSSSDAKFSYFYPLKGKKNEYNLKYDRFYTATQRPYKVLVDLQSGRMLPIPPTDDRANAILKVFLNQFGSQYRLIRGSRRGVDLHIFIENELMYSGPDPTGLDEYPFVLEAGYWTPEDEDPKYRIQGAVRCMRDPGKEVDRRRSMVLDMLDGVIRQGWKAKSGKVVNPDDLYGSGFRVLWMKETAEMTDAEQLQAPQIPNGLFQAMDVFDKDHDSLAGVNNEMLGAPEGDADIAALLAKVRSANGLVTLQTLFNSHRWAKTYLGRKQIKMIQRNYTPDKVRRILGEMPTREFYTKEFSKYDCVPVEGVLTDSQRQMYFAQLEAWKKAGAPIPWSELIDYAPMEKKDSLKKAMAAAEQAQSQQAQQDLQTQAITNALLNAQKFQLLATGQQKLSTIPGERAQANLDQAKAMKEIQSIDIENFSRTLQLLMTMAKMLSGGSAMPQQGQLPGPRAQGLAGMNPVGQA